MDDIIKNIYSGEQSGGELPYFMGSNQQWGGGILGTIARFAFPILKRVLGVAANTAEDVLVHKKKFKDSIIDNTMNEVADFVTKRGNTTTINEPKDFLNNRKRKKK